MSKIDPPWMAVNVERFVADTSHLNAAQFVALMLLLAHEYQYGPLTFSVFELCEIAKTDIEDYLKTVSPLVADFFLTGINGDILYSRARLERRRA